MTDINDQCLQGSMQSMEVESCIQSMSEERYPSKKSVVYQPNSPCSYVMTNMKKKLIAVGLGILLSLLSSSAIAEWSTRGYNGSYIIDSVPSSEAQISYESVNTSIKCLNHQFKLSTITRLNICHVHNKTLVDLRVFLNNKPTIKGIAITMEEWKMLLRMLPFIRREIRDIHHRLRVPN